MTTIAPPPKPSPAAVLEEDLDRLAQAVGEEARAVRRCESLRAIESVQHSWRIVRRRHGTLREEAKRVDPALVPRANHLAAEERRMLAELIGLHRRVFNLAQGAGRDEGRVFETLGAWVERCRAQLEEHLHLLQDAHYRDRGVAG